MKNDLLFLALFLYTSIWPISNSVAQPVSLSVMAGPNLTIGNFEGSSQSGKVGFQVQSLISYNINDKVAISSGLGFIQKRSADDISLTDEIGNPIGNGKLVYEGNYLELPISLTLIQHENIRLSAGPRFWYKIKGDIKLEELPVSAPTRELNNFDYGLGLDILIPVGDFRVGLFYNRAFNEFTDNPDVKFSNTMGFNLGYSIF